MIEELEGTFSTMVEPVRAAWFAFWTFLDGLDWEDAGGTRMELPLSARIVETALASLPDDRRSADIVAGIRIANLPDDGVVRIRRYWGW